MNFEVRITFPWIGLHIEEGESDSAIVLGGFFYHLFFFSPLPIIYCILLFVCQSLNNKPVRRTGQQSSIYKSY